MPKERSCGKTMAVMLHILMVDRDPSKQGGWAIMEAGIRLNRDPDWKREHLDWYSRKYWRLKNKCFNAGIPVAVAPVHKMKEKYQEFLRTRDNLCELIQAEFDKKFRKN